MRVLVCGDRNWRHGHVPICRELRNYSATLVIHGAARGADWEGQAAARVLEIPWLGFPAQWEKYRKAAGPIRNQQMLDEGKPDLVLAFHDDIENSRGTKDMVQRARKAGIEVRVIRGEDDA